MSETNEEQAQVGALLARCSIFEVGQDDEAWWALVSMSRECPMYWGYGPTQLEAIRAAVEAAEQGVAS